MGLEQWGASEQYYKIASGYPEYELGRVISQEKGLFRVVMDKEECTARVDSGRQASMVSVIMDCQRGKMHHSFCVKNLYLVILMELPESMPHRKAIL